MSIPVGFRVVGYGGKEQLSICLKEEHERINREVAIEQQWWADSVVDEEAVGLDSGHLIKIPEEGKHYRLLASLRSEKQPRSLQPRAYMLLLTIEARWSMSTEYLETTKDIFLAVTSLYRSEDLQQQLREKTNLTADGISAHSAGAVIDFDPQGIYVGADRHSVTALSDDFNPEYTTLLKTVIQKLEIESACHLILEKGYRLEGDEVREHDAVYHVCVSPRFGT